MHIFYILQNEDILLVWGFLTFFCPLGFLDLFHPPRQEFLWGLEMALSSCLLCFGPLGAFGSRGNSVLWRFLWVCVALCLTGAPLSSAQTPL